MRTSPLTNRGLTLPITVTLVLLMALAALLAGALPASAQGSAPNTPDQPSGTAVFIGGVDLEWNEVRGADSYGVQMYRNGQWTDLPADGIEIAFYGAGAIISELEPEGSSYWFRARAVNAHGSSEWSDFNFMAPTSQSKSGRQARPDNVPASGEPVISGTAQVGESLTVETTGIEDGNGLDRVQFRFQWVSHDGNADTDIANATDSTYTLVADDAGNTIKVRVAFTDRGGYAESLTGGETATVAASPNSPATGAPTISGIAQVGSPLFAYTYGIADADGLTKVSYSYQWVANDGTADTDITGATAFFYPLMADDAGNTIKVRVSFTDDAGNDESLTSAATEAVDARPYSPATGQPTGPDAYVTVVITSGDDTVSWSDPDECTSDYNTYLSLTSGPGWGTTSRTHIGSVASGSTEATQTISLNWTGNSLHPPIVKAELYCGTFDASSSQNVLIASTGLATQLYLGPLFTGLREGTYSSAPLTALTISSGTLSPTFDRGKNTYTAEVSSDVEVITLDPTVLTGYQTDFVRNPIWGVVLFCGPPCNYSYGNGTTTGIVLADADEETAGFQINLNRGENRLGIGVNKGERAADAGRLYVMTVTVANSPATGQPTISGTAQVGQTLTAGTSEISDVDGLTNVTYSYQWLADDADIAGATGDAYVLTTSEMGKIIKVGVSFTDDAGNDETSTSTATGTVNPAVQQPVANSPATGAPTISGTAQVGETLTADTSGIADADGLTNVSYSYQWLTSRDAEIASANEGSYVLTSNEIDKTIKVRVSFTDDGGNEETLTSAATGAVSPAVQQQQASNTPATGQPTISGTAQVGETLTADTSGISDADGLAIATFAYQWLADDAEIAGATGDAYVLTTSEMGKIIKVRVSFTDDAGNDESLTSTATGTVSPAVQPQIANSPATGAPTISGTAQVGETLTADTTGIADDDGLDNVSYSYQWVANDGTSDTDIADATDSTYTLVATDEGKTIKVRASFTDDAGNNASLTSAATGAVAAAPPSYITVGVREDTSDPNDIVTNFTVIWSDSDDCSTDYNAYLNIYPETGLGQETPSNQLHLGSAGFDETRLTKGLAGVQGSFEGFNVELYCGTDGSGRMVSRVDIAPWQSPTTRPSPGTYSSKPPLSALSVSHGTMTPTFESHTSDYTVPDVDNADTRITITAIPEAGYFVEFYEASDLPVIGIFAYGLGPNGPPTSDSADCVRAYNDDLGRLFELTDADPNTPGFQVDVYDGENYVHVRVLPTYCDGGTGYKLAITRAEGTITLPRPNRSATGLGHIRPNYHRGPCVGCTMNADVSRISDRDGWDESTFNYQWLADDAEITGATSSSYTVTDAELGKTLRVRVSFTDDRGNEESVTSPATQEVKLPNREPIGKPIILGTLQVGQTLTADVSGISDPNGMTNATFSYQWNGFYGSVRDREEYTLVDFDMGVRGHDTCGCQLIVTYTDDAGHEERVWSELIGVVAPRPNSLPTGAPAISGTAQVGETLTADTSGIADDDGLNDVTYNYQWVANDGTSDTDIAGATDSTYTLVVADEGKTIKVRASFTDDVGNRETLTSAATDAVSFATQQQTFNSPATGWPTISGTAQVGETLTADITGIADADGLSGPTFSYQWVANDGTSDTDIADAMDSTYTLAADDEAKTIKLRVSFTDNAGNEETLTSTATETVSYATQQQTSDSMATGWPTISGTAQVGETLTADTTDIADDDGLEYVYYSYQWVANEGSSYTYIADATDSTYTLVAADEGKTIYVVVSFWDDAGTHTTVTSAATATVTARPNTPATGRPAISGTVQVGETLTADTSGIADDDGLTNVSYSNQWLADDADIAGATASTYSLVAADEGKTIKVRVSFADDLGNAETVTSAATAAVEAPEPPAMPTGLSPSVSHDAVTLTWDDPQDDSITGYIILRRDRAIHPVGTFVTITGDTGSADTTYTDDTVEPDKRYVYRIKAINEHGEVSEISDWVRANTPAVPVPDKPTGLSAAVSHDAVTLTWDDPEDDAITGYVILRRDRAIHPVGTFVTIAGDTGSADSTYTDDTVEPDKEYVYRIKAINEHGEVSEMSDWVRGFTPAAPAPAGSPAN